MKLIVPRPNWDCEVITDHNRFQQIMLNLLSNSLKFTFKGGIIVRIEETRHSDRLKISVKDTGTGIEEKNKDKLFK